jgi:hypothetical protein
MTTTKTGRPDWRGRPAAEECNPYYLRYLARVPDGDLLETLTRAGAATMKLLRAIPREREEHRYEPGKWSVREVVGHAIDAERVFSYRALAFARADGNPLPGFEENEWAAVSNAGDRALAELCDDWAAVRASTVALLGGLDAPAAGSRRPRSTAPAPRAAGGSACARSRG